MVGWLVYITLGRRPVCAKHQTICTLSKRNDKYSPFNWFLLIGRMRTCMDVPVSSSFCYHGTVNIELQEVLASTLLISRLETFNPTNFCILVGVFCLPLLFIWIRYYIQNIMTRIHNVAKYLLMLPSQNFKKYCFASIYVLAITVYLYFD